MSKRKELWEMIWDLKQNTFDWDINGSHKWTIEMAKEKANEHPDWKDFWINEWKKREALKNHKVDNTTLYRKWLKTKTKNVRCKFEKNKFKSILNKNNLTNKTVNGITFGQKYSRHHINEDIANLSILKAFNLYEGGECIILDNNEHLVAHYLILRDWLNGMPPFNDIPYPSIVKTRYGRNWCSRCWETWINIWLECIENSDLSKAKEEIIRSKIKTKEKSQKLKEIDKLMVWNDKLWEKGIKAISKEVKFACKNENIKYCQQDINQIYKIIWNENKRVENISKISKLAFNKKEQDVNGISRKYYDIIGKKYDEYLSKGIDEQLAILNIVQEIKKLKKQDKNNVNTKI